MTEPADKRDRDEQDEESEARDRLHHVRETEHWCLKLLDASQQYPQRQADRDRETCGKQRDEDVLAGENEEFRVIGC